MHGGGDMGESGSHLINSFVVLWLSMVSNELCSSSRESTFSFPMAYLPCYYFTICATRIKWLVHLI